MTDEALQELMARRQIEESLIGYCLALDRMDLAALAALFTDDCTVDFGTDPRLNSRGADALQKSLARMWRWQRTSHHLSNVTINFESEDRARATSYVHAWHERADGSTATILGQYRDLVVRVSDKWLIAERRMLMNGCDQGFTVPIHPLERTPPPAGWTAPDIDRPGTGGS